MSCSSTIVRDLAPSVQVSGWLFALPEVVDEETVLEAICGVDNELVQAGDVCGTGDLRDVTDTVAQGDFLQDPTLKQAAGDTTLHRHVLFQIDLTLGSQHRQAGAGSGAARRTVELAWSEHVHVLERGVWLMGCREGRGDVDLAALSGDGVHHR